MSPSSRRDKRIESSRAAVYHALIELMAEKGIGAFSVTELCSRAGINRGTFYNHWKSIDELLFEYEDELLEGLELHVRDFPTLDRAMMEQLLEEGTPAPEFVACFDFFREKADFIFAALASDFDRRFYSKLRSFLADSFLKNIIKDRVDYQDEADADYFAWYLSYAFLGVVTRWALNGFKESSDVMALKLTWLLHA